MKPIQWLKDRKPDGRPFCLSVWFHEPHRVIATPEEFSAPYLGKFPDVAEAPSKGKKEAPTTADYLGNISHMDHQIGRLMDAIAGMAASENTLTVFTSDNGPIPPGSTGGFRGGKGMVWEGGIHLPGIIHWPRGIPPGQVSDVPAGGVDLLPTFCEVAGAEIPRDRAMDGTSLRPLFDGRPVARTTPLFWRQLKGEAALRDGDWKVHGFPAARQPGQGLIDFIAEAPLQRFELHNLKDDPGETTDLAAQHPEILARLSAKLAELHRQTRREGERWPENALPAGENGKPSGGKKKAQQTKQGPANPGPAPNGDE